MTKVNSVQNAQTQSPYSVFNSISKGIVGGAVAGYAAKYMLPLSPSEMDAEYKTITGAIRKHAKEMKGMSIEAIRNLQKKTPAQDVFLKMVDAGSKPSAQNGLISEIAESVRGAKNTTKNLTGFFKMKDIIKNSGLDENGIKELKNIIAQVNEKAAKTAKTQIKAYGASIKEAKRPAIAFMTAGAVAGFFAGLAHKVLLGCQD